MGDDAAEHCAPVKTPDTLSAVPLVEQANRGHLALLDDHVWPFQAPIRAWPLLQYQMCFLIRDVDLHLDLCEAALLNNPLCI